jgi:hypothetical protein
VRWGIIVAALVLAAAWLASDWIALRGDRPLALLTRLMATFLTLVFTVRCWETAS